MHAMSRHNQDGDLLLVFKNCAAFQFGEGLPPLSKETDRMTATDDTRSPLYYHGTRADLQLGDLIGPGYTSNYGSRRRANFVYLSATLEAATWGAELAIGEGRGRIYIVEPTGPIEDDPNLTDKKFPGNPTKSYRTRDPLRVTGEIKEWQGHSPGVLQSMKDRLEELRRQGIEAIEE
jgi:Rifampin ADP-ribosyl transferase